MTSTGSSSPLSSCRLMKGDGLTIPVGSTTVSSALAYTDNIRTVCAGSENRYS
jgi:hypothetical protein